MQLMQLIHVLGDPLQLILLTKVNFKLISQDTTEYNTDSSYYTHIIFKHEAAGGHSRDVASERLLFAVC